MGRFSLGPIARIEQEQFHKMLMAHVPPTLKKRMRSYVHWGLQMAEKHQVDPFWVMSVMWVESHFNPQARSKVNAMGLMQILPGTAYFIHKLMGRPIPFQPSNHLVQIPQNNIEMGVIYLKRMLRRFNNNYILATVAYNMGPTMVQRRLRYNLPVGVDNLYLRKVQRAYSRLAKKYRRYLKQRTVASKVAEINP